MISPWSSIVSGIRVQNCLGEPVRYKGIKFSGTPRGKFWGGFFELDIEDAIEALVDETFEDCKKYPAYSEAALMETFDLLRGFVVQVYGRMVEVDRILRSGVDDLRGSRSP